MLVQASMGCTNFPKSTNLNSPPVTSVPDKSLVEGNNEEVALLLSLALCARIDQALKKFHTCFLSQARIDFSLRLGMFYGALLYVFVLMQSQNPLFYGPSVAGLAWSALFLCRHQHQQNFFCTWSIEAVSDHQGKFMQFLKFRQGPLESGELDGTLQIDHDLTVN